MSLFKRKKPWVELQHEEQFIPKDYSERGVETGAKLEETLVGNEDLKRIFAATENMDLRTSMAWLEEHHEEFDESTFIVNTDDGNALDTLKGHHPRLIINKMGLTRIRHLNTFLNKAIMIYKLNVTNDPKKRPLFQRYNQTFVMIFTMILSLYRAKILVPKYGGLKLGLFQELSVFILIVTGVMMLLGLFFARKYDKVEDFERNYHKATDFNFKDIWNLIVHNPAFLMETISNATDNVNIIIPLQGEGKTE